MILAAITTHKRPPEMVERAVKSVIAQTYTDWNLVVVDDSPADWELRDDVRKMVEGYGENDSRIRYVAHDRNYGAQRARNTALKIACDEGFEFIAYLDDDDEWLPEKLSKQLEVFMSRGKDTALVYCGNYVIHCEDNTVTEYKREMFEGNVHSELLRGINFIGSTSLPLIRASCLNEVGGFDEEMQSVQDYDAYIRLAEHYEVGYVNEKLVNYYFGHGEQQISVNMFAVIRGHERLIKKNELYLMQDKYAYWMNIKCLVIPYLIVREYRNFFTAWLKLVSLQPLRARANIILLLRSFSFYVKMKLKAKAPKLYARLKDIKHKLKGETTN